MSQRMDLYGPDGPYKLFAGKDVRRTSGFNALNVNAVNERRSLECTNRGNRQISSSYERDATCILNPCKSELFVLFGSLSGS